MANVERLIELRRVIEQSDDYYHLDINKCVAGHAVYKTSFGCPSYGGGSLEKAKELLGLTSDEADGLFLTMSYVRIDWCPMVGNPRVTKIEALAYIDVLIEHYLPEYAAPDGGEYEQPALKFAKSPQ